MKGNKFCATAAQSQRSSQSVKIGSKNIEKINNSLGKLCSMLDLSDDEDDLKILKPEKYNSAHVKSHKTQIIAKAVTNFYGQG